VLGRRFAIYHAPNPNLPLRGLVVYVHPFAEEMNKSRRMAALQARALARAGFAVLQIDLLGCGDSAGDFGDATWDLWVNDIVQACGWLRRLVRQDLLSDIDLQPLWLWGLRGGCLLAAAAATKLNTACNFLFWQPAASGKTLLQQFLRLKAAAEMASGGGKAILAELRQDIERAHAVHVAGYWLHPDMAAGLEHATLRPPSPACMQASVIARMVWLEVSTAVIPTLSPASAMAVSKWELAGYAQVSAAVHGPAFWQTVEIEDAPQLVDATLAHLSATSPP